MRLMRSHVAWVLAALVLAALVLLHHQQAERLADLPAGGGKSVMSDELYRSVLQNMPIPTCDVLLMNPAKDMTLLFKRTNKPVQGVWYSLGGRLLKNEGLYECAVRKLRSEFGLARNASDLLFAGIVEEIFDDSAFDGINSHCLNSVFAYVLTSAEHAQLQLTATVTRLDRQHSLSNWFYVTDQSLHAYMRKKVAMVVNALRRAQGAEAESSLAERTVGLRRPDALLRELREQQSAAAPGGKPTAWRWPKPAARRDRHHDHHSHRHAASPRRAGSTDDQSQSHHARR